MDEMLRTAAMMVLLLQAPADNPGASAGAFIPPPRIAEQQQKADAWLGSDKFRHFWMSYTATAFSFAAARAAGADTDAALTVAVPFGALTGIGKEIYDRRRGERFSTRDLVADALGLTAAFFFLREVR